VADFAADDGVSEVSTKAEGLKLEWIVPGERMAGLVAA